MRNRIICLVFLFYSFSHGFSQTGNAKRVIDKICKKIDTDTLTQESIAEGEIYLKDSIVGGFSIYRLRDSTGKVLLRVIDENNRRTYYKATYYYYKRKIVKLIVDGKPYYTNNLLDKNIKDIVSNGMKIQESFYNSEN